MYDALLICTFFMVLKAEIQTSHCEESCANTSGRIGPDLREHGLFNYNNTIAFSHELMNSYTTQFTTSETPFNAVYNTILHTYKNESFVAPFCAEQTFRTAWYAFIKSQLNSDMQCSQCGPNPEIVIADGVSISFAKRQLGNLRPPTVSDQTTALVKLPRTSTKASCFIGPTRLRTAIQKALDEPDRSLGKGKLLPILAKEVQSP
jgi:hypothetical protein